MEEWRFPEVSGDSSAEREPPPPPAVPEPPPTPSLQSPKRPRRWIVVTLGLFGALLLLGAAVTAWRAYPWLRRPSASQAEIDRRWTKVEEWARSEGADTSDDLDAIAGLVTGFSPPVHDEHLPTLERDQLNEDQVAAMTRLVDWSRKGAPYAKPRCGSTTGGRSSLQLFRLGQLTLFSSKRRSDLPRVEAVLKLAQRMRRRGTVLELAVGAALAKLVSEWSHDRTTPLPAGFSSYRPEAAEIHGSLARDAVCMTELMASTGGKGLALDSPMLGADRERPPFGIVDVSREISVYKDYQGRILEQAFGVRSDWKQMADTYERGEIGKPKSVFLQALAFNANVIRRTGEDMDEYQPLTE